MAFDSMPAARRALLDHLAKHHAPISQTQLAEALGLTETYTRRRIEDLKLVGLVDRKEVDDNVDPDQRTVSISLSSLARDLLAGCCTV